jgi:hypothetical protein
MSNLMVANGGKKIFSLKPYKFIVGTDSCKKRQVNKRKEASR